MYWWWTNKVLHFVENLHVIKDKMFEIPPVFKLIKEESVTEWREMFKVFNMGHRMEIYIDEKYADSIIKISKSFDVEAKVIGRVEKAKSKNLLFLQNLVVIFINVRKARTNTK